MTPSDYRTIIDRFRKLQLKLILANVHWLDGIVTDAVTEITSSVHATGGSLTSHAVMQTLLQTISDRLRFLRSDLTLGLNASMLRSAQNAADREAATAELVGAASDARLLAARTLQHDLSTGEAVKVQFSQIAHAAVDAAGNKKWQDGLTLPDRLRNLGKSAEEVVESTFKTAVVEDLSGPETAKILEEAMVADGADNPRYKVLRIARTEINSSFREANSLAVKAVDGSLKSYVQGIKWNLSLSHMIPDICDVWAADDNGLGPGVFAPGDVPGDHPNGLCYTTTAIADAPDVGGPGREPKERYADGADVRRYAAAGDPSAQRWLNQYAGTVEDED